MPIQTAIDLRAMAQRLLVSYGELMTFIRKTEGLYNPATASATEPTSATYSGMGYAYPFSSFERANSLAQTDDRIIIIHKMSAPPKVGDQVTFRSFSLRVTSVNQISVSGLDVAYQLEAKI